MTKLGDESMIGYSANYNAQIKRIFHVLGSSANYPAYFHCKIGSDRTGSIAFLVLGLCGVDEDYLYRDYLASTFANTETARTMDRTETFLKYAFMGKNTSTKIDWSSYATKYGDSLAGHVRGYLEFCGVSDAEMSALTTALTGETIDEVLARVNAYETEKGYKTLNFVAYPSSTTTNATFRLASSLDAQVMAPSTTPSRSGYTFDGWDIAGAANGLVCAKWTTTSTTFIEWIGQGADTLWGTAENWDPSYDASLKIRFSSSAGNRKTATLDGNYNVSGNVEVTGGNAAAPIVWTATDDAVAASNALTQTSTDCLDISGDLKVEKGIWNFANDIRVNDGGTLRVTGGRVTTQFWMPVTGDSSIVVDGGELVTGYRNGETDNGRINLGTTANKTVTLTQNGGRIRCSNRTASGNDVEALTLGEASGTSVTVNLNGGECVVNGRTHIGYGTNSKATLAVNGGTLTAKNDLKLGWASGATSELSIGSGGNVTVNSGSSTWIFMANATGSSSKITLNEGGTLTAWHIQNINDATAEGTSSEFAFNGGTLKCQGSDASQGTWASYYLLGNSTTDSDTLNVTISEKGGAIDCNGKTVRINRPITGAGTLTITNSASTFGTLTFYKTPTCGLALAGPVKLAVDSGVSLTDLTLKSGSFALTDLPLTDTTGAVTVEDATLILPYDNAATNVVLKGGALVVDISGAETLEEGAEKTFTLSNVTLADGVEVSDITFKFSGQNFSCTPSWNSETKTLTVSTAAPTDGDNHWVGGSYGTFETASNWTRGKPVKDQRIVFDNAATVSFTTKPDIGTLVFNADVTFNRGTGGEKFHIQGAEGKGTLTLDYMGIANISGTSASISNNLNMINGAWFGDYQYSGDLSVYGDISGSGLIKIWGKDGNLNFYGDNSGFKGSVQTVDSHRPVYFRAPKAGFPNATSFELTGTLWLWFDEGTITFGGLKLHSTGNRGINMPTAAATSAKGVTLVVGNNDGTVSMDGDNTYQAYTKTDTWWTTGCANFTLRKVGTGSFTCYFEEKGNLALEGGTTTFTHDCTATTIAVTNATIKAAANRTLGTVSFGSGSCLAADLAWDTTTDGDTVTTNGLKTATLMVTGSTDLGNLIVTLGNTGLTNQVDSTWTKMPTLLTATTLTGTPTLGCTAISNLVAKVANNKLTLAYGTSFTPDETSATTYATAIAATNAANTATVQLSSTRIELGQLADYFTNVVTKVSDSSYTVTTRLNEEKVMPTSSAMTSSDSAGSGVKVTANNVKKGLYYKLLSSTDGTTFASGGESTLATGNSESFTLTNSDDHGTSKVIYYKVQVSDTAQ